MDEDKIPKVIHYCWFGRGEKNESIQKCIEGWRKKLPDYEIKEWNEENFDININNYVQEAYDKGKYAFVSDYVRLFALYNYGGIYLDTDVEVLKNFDKMLNLNAFIGFEDRELLSTATIGSKKNNIFIKEWLESYSGKKFIVNGKAKEITNVRQVTNLLLLHGLSQNNKKQSLYNDNITIFPIEYFSPLKIGGKRPKVTSKTITIHWFDGSWLSMRKRIKIKIIILIKAVIGFKNYNKIKEILNL